MKKLKGTYRKPRLYTRAPHEHALHLRWLSDEFINQIKQAAKQRNMSTVHFVTDVLKR